MQPSALGERLVVQETPDTARALREAAAPCIDGVAPSAHSGLMLRYGRVQVQTPPIEYLFDPELVAERLVGLPRMQGLIRDPRTEGVESTAFPKLRKTRREVLRVLGRHHVYANLDRLLNEIERLLKHGWTTHQLRASSHDEFGSLVSEVLVACHFAGAGFDIAPTVGEMIAGVKPEFYATRGDVTVGVEVFQPRDWQLIDTLTRKGRQLLYDADIPFDYAAALELRLDHQFDDTGKLVHPHPALLEAGLAVAGTGFFLKLMREVDAIAPTSRTLIVSRPDVNLEFEVRIDPIQPAAADTPERSISHGWSTSAYVPEAIFHDILERVVDKAKRKQAGPPGSPHARLLAVDLSTSPIQPHLYDDPRQALYVEDVRNTLGPCVALGDYDAVALCDPSFANGLTPLLVCTSDKEVAASILGVLPAGTVVCPPA